MVKSRTLPPLPSPKSYQIFRSGLILNDGAVSERNGEQYQRSPRICFVGSQPKRDRIACKGMRLACWTFIGDLDRTGGASASLSPILAAKRPRSRANTDACPLDSDHTAENTSESFPGAS